MTTVEHSPPTSAQVTSTATATLVPYLSVGDAVTAIDWYVAVLEAVEILRYVSDDGRIGHAEISVGGAVVSESTYESGGNVVCRDDQGREFQLWQPAPGY